MSTSLGSKIPAAATRASHASEGPSPWPRFLRGLSIGVFVGAAIAGSRLWGYRRAATGPELTLEKERGKAGS
ncbi:MAG: hypothetical protein ABI598_00490 [Chloroflexota bacterium]